MAYKIEVTNRFHEDVRSTMHYIEAVLRSPQAAERLMEKVDDAMELLAEMPLLSAVSQRGNLVREGIRIHFVANYAIAYKIKGETVAFVRLFHQSQFYESDEHWPDSL